MILFLRSALLLSFVLTLPFSLAARGEDASREAEAIPEITVHEAVPSSVREAEQKAAGGRIEFDADRARRGVEFLSNQEEIVGEVVEISHRLLDYLDETEVRYGAKQFKDWKSNNHRALTVYQFNDGTWGQGDQLTDPVELERTIEERGGLKYKAEPTTITVGEGDNKTHHMILKVVDYERDVTFVYPGETPLDSEHLNRYIDRQNYLAGKSSGVRGRDVILLQPSFDSADGSEAVAEFRPRYPVFSREGFRRRFNAYYQPTLWPESWIEAVWSTFVQLGTAAGSLALAKVVLPDVPISNLMTVFTLGFGMGVGLQNGTYRNWVNAGNTALERVVRRSALGVTFAVTYSIAESGGVSHLSVIDVAGLTNWALLLGNVALAKVGSDPITDFNRVRNELRANTKQMVFVPRSALEGIQDAEEFAFEIGGRRIVIPRVRVTSEQIHIAVPGLRAAKETELKWQAFEAPVVNILASFSKLFDQVMMGAVAGAAVTGQHSLAQTLGMALLGKSFLLLQIPAGRRFVLWYAEKRGFEDAAKMRASWERNFTPRGWLKRMAALPGRFRGYARALMEGLRGKASACLSALEPESAGRRRAVRSLILATLLALSAAGDAAISDSP